MHFDQKTVHLSSTLEIRNSLDLLVYGSRCGFNVRDRTSSVDLATVERRASHWTNHGMSFMTHCAWESAHATSLAPSMDCGGSIRLPYRRRNCNIPDRTCMGPTDEAGKESLGDPRLRSSIAVGHLRGSAPTTLVLAK